MSRIPPGALLPPLATPFQLDVIMPVFNEADTVREVIDEVLALDMPGVRLVLTIIESNSRDGSREAVMAYADHPDVNIVLEERPGGKGLAVRKGLSLVDGDVVLIQDADLEYEISDYPRLLAPIRSGAADFVIGSRSLVTSAIRDFPDQPMMARVLNAGHAFFVRMFNVVFGSELSDPFSMYKVFRRECIAGMAFRATRFDFDWELAAKIIRRGFVPLEIPVSYDSRSYNEGKKVRLFRDPLTWFWICARVRMERPDWSPAREWVVRAGESEPERQVEGAE